MTHNGSNWDNYRDNSRKAAQGGNYRSWDGGKGDIDRSTHTKPYQLGFELIKIAEEFGKDSKEYEAKLAEWKQAVKDAQ